MPYCIALLKKCSLLGKKTYRLSLDSGWKLATLCSECKSILCYHKLTLLQKKKKVLGNKIYKHISKTPEMDLQSYRFFFFKLSYVFLSWN